MEEKIIYKEILNNIPEGILICDTQFNIIRANIAAENLFCINKEDFSGKSLSKFISLEKVNCPICMGKIDASYIPEQFNHSQR
ncbi:MAG: PAS domain-containing protein [Desulfosudis oleivorans]|nr:PAS domain-containing protein [Desulfosudis oleivorans]